MMRAQELRRAERRDIHSLGRRTDDNVRIDEDTLS